MELASEGSRSGGGTPQELQMDDEATAHAVHRLGRLAYAVEADLIGHQGIPALTETLEQLRAEPLRWLGVLDDGRLVGFLAWTRTRDGELDIDRLCVDPGFFRRGIARRLLDHLLTAEPGGDVLVSTGAANGPALRLYGSVGFAPTGTVEPTPGLLVTTLRLAR